MMICWHWQSYFEGGNPGGVEGVFWPFWFVIFRLVVTGRVMSKGWFSKMFMIVITEGSRFSVTKGIEAAITGKATRPGRLQCLGNVPNFARHKTRLPSASHICTNTVSTFNPPPFPYCTLTGLLLFLLRRRPESIWFYSIQTSGGTIHRKSAY